MRLEMQALPSDELFKKTEKMTKNAPPLPPKKLLTNNNYQKHRAPLSTCLHNIVLYNWVNIYPVN